MRYSIIESCMRPSGAYAKTTASFRDEATARTAYQRAAFEGPGFGIFWGQTLQLVQSDYCSGQHTYEVLATRTLCD
jgi:hypothetical protein